MYLHRLIVRRKHAGLGTEIMDWASRRAHRLGLNWLRIDVWTDNIGLHRYCEQNGFKHVRTLDLTDYPSEALFQRAAILGAGNELAQIAALSASRPVAMRLDLDNDWPLWSA